MESFKSEVSRVVTSNRTQWLCHGALTHLGGGRCNECVHFVKALNKEKRNVRSRVSFKSIATYHKEKRMNISEQQDSVWEVRLISVCSGPNLPKGRHNPNLNQYFFFCCFAKFCSTNIYFLAKIALQHRCLPSTATPLSNVT